MKNYFLSSTEDIYNFDEKRFSSEIVYVSVKERQPSGINSTRLFLKSMLGANTLFGLGKSTYLFQPYNHNFGWYGWLIYKFPVFAIGISSYRRNRKSNKNPVITRLSE